MERSEIHAADPAERRRMRSSCLNQAKNSRKMPSLIWAELRDLCQALWNSTTMRSRSHVSLLLSAVFLAAMGWVSVAAQAIDFQPVAKTVTDFGYILNATRWRWGPFDPKIVFVCWENPEPPFFPQMISVQRIVTDTWQQHSGLEFRGWDVRCSPSSVGIRIKIADEGPHTKGLGRQIDGVPSGMVLNFVFDVWSPECKKTAIYQKCLESIAVHEFGHALGFAHEQNRPDTPGECAKLAQGTSGDMMLTSWDIRSVMNYCNPIYNNDGNLSAYDVESLQKVYGRKSR